MVWLHWNKTKYFRPRLSDKFMRQTDITISTTRAPADGAKNVGKEERYFCKALLSNFLEHDRQIDWSLIFDEKIHA